MANDSSTGGFLAPLLSPIYDDALDDALHTTVVGVTGLPDNLVSPRWQANGDPNLPAFGTDWCAAGVHDWEEPGGYPAELASKTDPTDPTAKGVVTVSQQEDCTALLSFYGPNANANAAAFAKGITLGQNQEVLTAAGLMVVGVSGPVITPEQRKMQWMRRVDIRLHLRRLANFVFAIRFLSSAAVEIQTDSPNVNPVNVNVTLP